ncbi:MAG: fasciclin domain-containing protein [Nonlabens sp.]|nr:fasciclin domain-containing protein [Nonlabens sp.]
MTMTDESMDNDMGMEEDTMEEETVMVGGAEMYPSKNIVENASQSSIHTTLVAAVKAADLVGTLSSEGPFTVFAPTNEAFDALPKGTVETLLKPENKSKLAGILTYHVVPGRVDAISVLDMIKSGNGKAMAKTVAGAELTFTTADGNVYVTDVAGNKAQVTQADVRQSNGIIHVVNKVLMPTK